MNHQNKKLIIFDFDGVLADTEKFCFKIHKKVNKNLTWEKFQDFCNGNFIDGIKEAVDGESHIIPSNFYERYVEEISLINIRDTLRTTIQTLSKDNIIVIVSSTNSDVISNFLTKEKLRNCFTDILGADVHKNKTIKISTLLKKYDKGSKDAVFITDSLGDILEANNCGVQSIGVTWGIHGKETLEKGHPRRIINDPSDLFDSIKNVLK